MNDQAKIHLSTLEMELVNNTDWIFTKSAVIQKVQNLFGQLHHRYRNMVEDEKKFLPSIFQKPGGKISKGENYNGLPYLILDYPAIFSRDNIFAVRTLFWWGNFFSISLHLSGKNFENREDVAQWLAFFQKKNFWICNNENEWEHDFNASNFIEINKIDEIQIQDICKKDFFKVAKKIELRQWNQVPGFLEQSFGEIIQFIKISFPNDGKVP